MPSGIRFYMIQKEDPGEKAAFYGFLGTSSSAKLTMQMFRGKSLVLSVLIKEQFP